MSINKITRENYPDNFHIFINCFCETADDEYDISRMLHTILNINEKTFPQFPEIWGFWKPADFGWIYESGTYRANVNELIRVEQKTQIIEEKYWAPIQEEEPTNQVSVTPKVLNVNYTDINPNLNLGDTI